MTGPVKTRPYRSPRRRAQAAATRRAVLHAARELFACDGYDATTVSAVARAAGVSVDTVYASVGRKPELVLAVVDMLLGSSDEPVPAAQRDYVQAIGAAATAAEKIGVYAAAMSRLMPVIAPLFVALRRAAEADPVCAQVWTRLTERRAANMRRFAAELRATGELRADLDDDEVADIVWSTNAVEYYQLLTSRGWDADRYGRLLADLWSRVLLAGSGGGGAAAGGAPGG